MQVLRSHSAAPKRRQSNDKMENDMTGKIFAIVAAAVVLASASVATAQTRYAPNANSYYNQDTRNLRFGHANDPQFDPYAGTVFQGVAPY